MAGMFSKGRTKDKEIGAGHGQTLHMPKVEFALDQGPVCFAGLLRGRWPRVSVSVESLMVFRESDAYETLRLEGEEVPSAMRDVRRSLEENELVVLEESGDRARFRYKIIACPLVPLLTKGRLRPSFPFKVEPESDRWYFEDDPEVLKEIFSVLGKEHVMPKMIRRDPERRP